MVHRGQDAKVAVGDRDARVLEQALLRPPRGPAAAAGAARLALRTLGGHVELLEVWLDDCAVELAADAAEVGEDGRQVLQWRVQQLAQLVVFGVLVGFDQLGGVVCAMVRVGPSEGTVAQWPRLSPTKRGPSARRLSHRRRC